MGLHEAALVGSFAFKRILLLELVESHDERIESLLPLDVLDETSDRLLERILSTSHVKPFSS